MGWTITNIWNLLTYDVEDTVYGAAIRILEEGGVNKEIIKMRAAAMKEIGVIFQVWLKLHMPSAQLTLLTHMCFVRVC